MEKEIEKLLSYLCIAWGFCIPSEDVKAFKKSDYLDADAKCQGHKMSGSGLSATHKRWCNSKCQGQVFRRHIRDGVTQNYSGKDWFLSSPPHCTLVRIRTGGASFNNNVLVRITNLTISYSRFALRGIPAISAT